MDNLGGVSFQYFSKTGSWGSNFEVVMGEAQPLGSSTFVGSYVRFSV